MDTFQIPKTWDVAEIKEFLLPTADGATLVTPISEDVEGSIGGLTGDLQFSKNKLGKSFFTATAKSETIRSG